MYKQPQLINIVGNCGDDPGIQVSTQLADVVLSLGHILKTSDTNRSSEPYHLRENEGRRESERDRKGREGE